jgi:anti-sigma B factor antagonist
MTHGENYRTAVSGAGIEIVSLPAELDLTTSEGVAEQGCAAIARPARLVLLDLTGLSFCDARGLSAFVRIANQADAAGCGFALRAVRR